VAAGGEPGCEDTDDAPGSPSSPVRKNRTMVINPLLISSMPSSSLVWCFVASWTPAWAMVGLHLGSIEAHRVAYGLSVTDFSLGAADLVMPWLLTVLHFRPEAKEEERFLKWYGSIVGFSISGPVQFFCTYSPEMIQSIVTTTKNHTHAVNQF
jgi:hypothetical protein